MPIAQVHRANALTKPEFHSQLRHWIQTTNEMIVGDTNIDPRTPWIWIKDESGKCILHPDTSRNGVITYLKLVQEYGDELEWTVVLSQRGKPTKIAFGPHAQTIPGFYLYVEGA